MRRLFGGFLLAIAVLLMPLLNANAASKCDYDEQVKIGNSAANVKVTFEEVEKSLGMASYSQETGEPVETIINIFKINIFNLSEDIYIKVTNDYNKETKTYGFNNSESGVVSFDWEHLDKVSNFTITVYSSPKTNCANEEYRIIYLTVPRYNDYYDTANCTNNEGFYLCQKYITETTDVDYDTFSSKLTAYNNKNSKEETKEKTKKTKIQNIIEFVKKNKIPVAAGATIIVAGGVVAIVVVAKKRRSRLI